MRAPNYIPQPSRHAKGLAVVRLNGKDFYLGPYGSPEAKAKYERLIADWLANGRQLPEADLTVNEVILAYLKHAHAYYKPVGKKSGEIGCISDALAIVKNLYGRTSAVEFGPKALKAVRERMVQKDWCRKYINHQIDRVRRMFRWATEEELLPGFVYHALQSVRGLRKGKPGVRESEKVRPAPWASIKAVLPLVRPVVRAMIRFQYLTGCRPEEVCILRPMDIRKGGTIWVYRPASHKTEHHDKERQIFIGPKAQRLLRPWLKVAPEAYVFSPARSEADRNGERRRSRQSPMTPSQAKRQPKKDRRRSPRDRYDTASYRRAIKRACKKAKVAEWSPNQLRHNAATRLRKKYGIEVARIILGHSTLVTTQIYAEADWRKAMEVMGQVG